MMRPRGHSGKPDRDAVCLLLLLWGRWLADAGGRESDNCLSVSHLRASSPDRGWNQDGARIESVGNRAKNAAFEFRRAPGQAGTPDAVSKQDVGAYRPRNRFCRKNRRTGCSPESSSTLRKTGRSSVWLAGKLLRSHTLGHTLNA